MKRCTALVLATSILGTTIMGNALAPMNPARNTVPINLDIKYWYQVKLPAAIDLTYDSDTLEYNESCDLLVRGEIPGKALRIETDDIELSGENEILNVETGIGQLDSDESEHAYTIGEHDNEILTKDWQSFKITTKVNAHGVKTGDYSGSAKYKFRLVDNSKLYVATTDYIAKPNSSNQLVAMKNGVNVADQMTWTSSNSSMFVSDDGTLKVRSDAKPGTKATITGVYIEENDKIALLDLIGPIMANAKEPETVSFDVTVATVDFKQQTTPVNSFDVRQGAKQTYTADVIGVDKGIKWSTDATDGINLAPHGNKCDITVDDFVPANTRFNVIAKLGNMETVVPSKVVNKKRIDESGFVKTETPGPWQKISTASYSDENGVLHVFGCNYSSTAHYTYDGTKWENLGNTEHSFQANSTANNEILFELNGTKYISTRNTASTTPIYKVLDNNSYSVENVGYWSGSSSYDGVFDMGVHDGKAYIFGWDDSRNKYRNDSLWYKTFDGQTVSDKIYIGDNTGLYFNKHSYIRLQNPVSLNGKLYVLGQSGNSSNICVLNEQSGTLESVCAGVGVAHMGDWDMVSDGQALYVLPVRVSYSGGYAYMFDGKEAKQLPSYPCSLPKGSWVVNGQVHIISGDMKEIYRYNETANIWEPALMAPTE